MRGPAATACCWASLVYAPHNKCLLTLHRIALNVIITVEYSLLFLSQQHYQTSHVERRSVRTRVRLLTPRDQPRPELENVTQAPRSMYHSLSIHRRDGVRVCSPNGVAAAVRSTR